MSWTYDVAGRRSSMTDPDGRTTDYTYDEVGRLVAVDHPLLGRAYLERDESGRLVQATAGSTIQSWDYHDGFVVAHSVTDPEGSTRTLLSRDGGRITTNWPGLVSEYTARTASIDLADFTAPGRPSRAAAPTRGDLSTRRGIRPCVARRSPHSSGASCLP